MSKISKHGDGAWISLPLAKRAENAINGPHNTPSRYNTGKPFVISIRTDDINSSRVINDLS